MTQPPVRLRLVLFTVLALWLSNLPAEALATDRRVAVRPVEIYNAADIEASVPGLQAALASRLSAPGCQVFTLKTGEPINADWAVRVTVTRVEKRMSVDGAAEPVSGQGEVLRAYEISESTDGLFAALSSVATALRKGILSSPVPVARPLAPQAPAAPVVSSPASPGAPTIPAPTLSPAAPQPPTLSGAESSQPFPVEPQGLSKSLATYRFTAPVSGIALSLAVGDIDGDGSPEMLVLTSTEIIAFRDDGRELKEQWRSKVDQSLRPLSISIGDVDGDGIPEVFVAGLRGEGPATVVYQWASAGLALHGPVVPTFLRAIVHPEKGLLLLGMGSEGEHLFGGRMRTYGWSEGTYRDKGVFAAPPGALVTDIDWHRLREGEPPWAVQTTQDRTLRFFDAGGKAFFSGTDEVKGSENVVESKELADQNRLDGDLYSFQGKTVLWRDASGTPQLLLQKNYAFTTAFRRSISYTKGQIVAFHWEGLGLVPSGESVKLPGFFAAVDSGPSKLRPGGTTLYAVLNQSEGILFTNKTLRVLAWDL